MDRETFRKLSMGHYCWINLQGTIDKIELITFSQGAVWAFDELIKTKTKDTEQKEEIYLDKSHSLKEI